MAGSALQLPWDNISDDPSGLQLSEPTKTALKRVQENFDRMSREFGSFANTDAQPITFLNSWHDNGGGFQTAEVWRGANNTCHLRGTVSKTGNWTAGDVILAVPAGFYPGEIQSFGVLAENNAAVFGAGRVDLYPNGNLQLVYGAPANPIGALHLNGLTWRTP